MYNQAQAATYLTREYVQQPLNDPTPTTIQNQMDPTEPYAAASNDDHQGKPSNNSPSHQLIPKQLPGIEQCRLSNINTSPNPPQFEEWSNPSLSPRLVSLLYVHSHFVWVGNEETGTTTSG
ncbi:hypothetical protein Droror1_Dr00023470 [Drosera rotundifolia]